MAIEDLKGALPEYAKDLKLNLSSLNRLPAMICSTWTVRQNAFLES